MARKSNQTLCKEFRELLTNNFYTVNSVGEIIESDPGKTLALLATKPWRNELWKAFREIEDRLCPLEAMERAKK